MTLADQAVSLARRGFFVFPCIVKGKSKKPALKGWKEKATRDEAQIRVWWDGDFERCAIGIAHGRFGDNADYLVTLDCDNKHGKNGADRLFELELEHGDLPRTYTQRTQSGGLHYVFKTKHPLKGPVDFRPGLDLRGARNLIYGAGSVWNGKTYTVEHDADVAEAPDWLVQLAGIQAPKELKEEIAEGVTLDTDDQIKRAQDYLETTEPAVRGNAGDERVLHVAMKVGDLGISQYECMDLMQKHFADRCAPALDPAYLEQKVENAYAYRTEPLGNALATGDFDEAKADDFPIEKAPEKFRNPVVHWPDEDDAPEPDPLIDGIMDKGACVILYGKPNVGKTFVAYTMSRHIAAGDPLAEREVEQGAVLYVQAEGHSGVNRRRKALKKFYKDKRIPFSIVKASVNLVKNAADRQWLADTIKATQAFYGVPVVLVVIDTFSASAPGMDENAAGDVSGAIAAMKSFTCDAGITLLLVHHEGKNASGGPRGSSAFMGNVDTVIHCVDGNIVSDKARESAKLDPIPYTLEVLEVGVTAKGRKVTSCVAKMYGPSARDFGGIPMTEAERQALDCLALLAAEAEEDVGITYSAWKKAFTDVRNRNNSCPSQDSIRKALDRAGQGLRTKGYVRNDLKDQWFIVSRT
jgi:hypothetical protein